MHHADAVAVLGEAIGRHAHPAVVHPERPEDRLAHVSVVGAAVDRLDDLAQDRHAARGVIAGALARLPVEFGLGRIDPRHVVGHRLTPRPRLEETVGEADSGGVGEEVTECDVVLAVGAERRQVPHDRIVEADPAELPLLRDGDREVALLIENQVIIESVVIGTPGAAMPIARSASSPAYETYSCAPRWVPSSMPRSSTVRVRSSMLGAALSRDHEVDSPHITRSQ